MKHEVKHQEGQKTEDKLDALEAFRQSKGLCFTYGEKWNRSHKCPDNVPLHVIEELLEVLQIQPKEDEDSDSLSESAEEAMMVFGKSSLSGNFCKKSF
jgi:hypothetical protein